MSARITDNIHLKGHTYLISGHDGKAHRGQDIFDEKGRTGRNNEISSSLPPLCSGKPSNAIIVTNKNCKLCKKRKRIWNGFHSLPKLKNNYFFSQNNCDYCYNCQSESK